MTLLKIWEEMAAQKKKTGERKGLWGGWMDEDTLHFLPPGLWSKLIPSFLERTWSKSKKNLPPAGTSLYKKCLTADLRWNYTKIPQRDLNQQPLSLLLSRPSFHHPQSCQFCWIKKVTFQSLKYNLLRTLPEVKAGENHPNWISFRWWWNGFHSR